MLWLLPLLQGWWTFYLPLHRNAVHLRMPQFVPKRVVTLAYENWTVCLTVRPRMTPEAVDDLLATMDAPSPRFSFRTNRRIAFPCRCFCGTSHQAIVLAGLRKMFFVHLDVTLPFGGRIWHEQCHKALLLVALCVTRNMARKHRETDSKKKTCFE